MTKRKRMGKKPDIKFIYFDVGGVLLDWKGWLRSIAIQEGVDVKKLENVFLPIDRKGCLGELSTYEVWEEIRTNLKLPNRKDFDIVEYAFSYFRPIVQTHDFLKRLAKTHRVGLLTNTYAGAMKRSLKDGLIPDLPYHVFIQSCDIKMVKPDANIFHLARERAGVNHSQILFIDDMKENINSAKKLGWEVVHFNTQNPTKSIRQIEMLL